MFKHSSEVEKKCPECKQVISSIDNLISDDEIITYNEKTSLWTKRRLNGNKKT